MKNAKGIFLCLSLIILITAFGLASFTGAENLVKSPGESSTIWRVHPTDPHANFQTIQAAIDNTSVATADSIEVWNGTYNETVVVDKRLTVYSRDGASVTIVDAQGADSAITLKADGCTIDGFTATGCGVYPGDAGIKVESNGNIIENNICYENNIDGVRLSDSSSNLISNNTCRANNRDGIYLWKSSNNTISKNKIGDKNRYGICFSDSSNNVIVKNKISKNQRSGIYMSSSSNNTVSNNSCYQNNWEGIYLADSSHNLLLNNEIGDNDHEGIHLEDSSHNLLLDNEICDNDQDGIYFSAGSTNNAVSNNEIRKNSQAGIHMENSASNLIYRNDFVNNSYDVDSYNSDNIWNSPSMISYTSTGSHYTNYTGNYWRDYAGADDNSDGIGDVPYDISEELGEGAEDDHDYYPLIQPFTFYITGNELPVAEFTYLPREPVVNERVTFDASLCYDPDGVIILYHWDFGDGNITSTAESIITHSYRTIDNYTVKLTATDNASATSSTSKVVPVHPLRFPAHNLNSSENFSTIQDAISALNTSDGHIIEVDSGTYNGNIIVNKSLTIRSTSGTAIVNAANPNDHVFEVIADYVIISGFTITGATETSKAGVYLNGTVFCYITNNEISDNYYGIYLLNSATNNVSTNTFSNSTLWDFYILDSEENNFSDNTLSSYPTAITFAYAGDIALRGVRAPPADPSGYENISKYVTATNVSANSWLLLNISYTDVGNVDESSLRMFRYNGTDWELVPEVNGVEEAENYVYANIISFSIFAPMGVPLPPVHNLNTSENFSTLQAAISDSKTTDGHIIEVDSGTYTENVHVNKSLTIRSTSGNPADTIVQAANSNGDVFTITADYVTISGFTIKGATGDKKAGILLSSSNNTITNNNASSNYVGIALFGSTENRISNNTANSNSYAGIALFNSSNNNTIANNTANDNKIGLIGYPFGGGSSNTIANNHFDYNYDGINLLGLFAPSDNNAIVNNSVTFNDDGGIFIVNSNNNTIENNNCSHTQLFSGIEIVGISSNNVINNNVANSNGRTGINLLQSDSSGSPNNNTITNNTACYNKYSGIQLTDSASYNSITNNYASFNNFSGIALFQSSSNNIIANNELFSNLIGLSLMGRNISNNQITNNTVNHSKSYGLWLKDLRHTNAVTNNYASNNNLFGILVLNSINNSISYNTAKENERGFGLTNSSEIQVINNVVDSNEISGLSLIKSTKNIIHNNSARFNTYEGIYLSDSSSNTISSNNVSGSPDLRSYFGISLYSSNNNTIADNVAESNYYFEVFLYSSTRNDISNNSWYTQEDIIRGVKLALPESLTPSLQTVASSTNATYYIIVENLGNVRDTFDLSISSIDNPEILSLDTYNVSLGAGEISADISGLKFETVKLNVTDSEPGIYRAKVEAISRNDNTVKDVIETRTIVQGELDSEQINSTVINAALIDSSINNAIINRSAIINSFISDSTITDSKISNSEVVDTFLSDVIVEDAIVNSGNISSGAITKNGIRYEIKNETRISDLVIGEDYSDSDLVGIKYIKTLDVDAKKSNISFDISAKGDYFAGSMRVQKAVIPPNGIPEFTNNVGDYVYADASNNLVNSTDWLIIKVFYNQTELGEFNESTLILRYYNETADPPGWEEIPISGVNLTGNYVWGNITHYSVFALIAQPPAPPGPGAAHIEGGGRGTGALPEEKRGVELAPPTLTVPPSPSPTPAPVPVIGWYILIAVIVAILVAVAYLVLRRRKA